MTCPVDLTQGLLDKPSRDELFSSLERTHLATCAACRTDCERARRLASTWKVTGPTPSEIRRARARWERSGRVSAMDGRGAFTAGLPVFDPGIVRWAAGGAALALALMLVMNRPWQKPDAGTSRGAAVLANETVHMPAARAILLHAGERVPAVEGLRVHLAPGELAEILGVSGAVLELRGPGTVELHSDETMACGFRAEILDDLPRDREPAMAPPRASASAPLPLRVRPTSAPTMAEPAILTPPAEVPPAPEVPPVASAPAAASAWAIAAEAMRTGNAAGADRAFSDLSRSADPAERDAARLARAELWMANGHAAEARPALAELAASGATPLVRRRARALLAGEK